MPITKQAIKKLRRDRKRAKTNARDRKTVRDAVKSMRATPGKKTLTEAFSTLDRAAKKHLIHPNKANRLKSRLARLTAKPSKRG